MLWARGGCEELPVDCIERLSIPAQSLPMASHLPSLNLTVLFSSSASVATSPLSHSKRAIFWSFPITAPPIEVGIAKLAEPSRNKIRLG